jgi:hypothetical protein
VPDVQELANTIAVASTASLVQFPIVPPRMPVVLWLAWGCRVARHCSKNDE